MAGKILQINFKFDVPVGDYIDAVTPLAAEIAAVPGLRWKVWLMDEAAAEAGGVYWFADAASLQAYLDGPIVDGIANHPALRDISVKVFDAIGNLSEITHAPIAEMAAA